MVFVPDAGMLFDAFCAQCDHPVPFLLFRAADFMNSSSLRVSLDGAIHNSLAYLHNAQLDYGEFKCNRSAVPSLAISEFDSSPFATTFVLYCLSFESSSRVRDVIARGLRFLLEERTSQGVWSYRSSRNIGRTPLEPDIDTTACAQFLIRELLPLRVNPGTSALILANTSEKGLFKTWLRNSHAPNDVDAVVNANVLLCLGELEDTSAVVRSALVVHLEES